MIKIIAIVPDIEDCELQEDLLKKEILGDEDSIPELRHGKLDVIIKPEMARYEDL